MLFVLSLFAVAAFAQGQNWTKKTWSSAVVQGNTESISEGSAYQCSKNTKTCKDNAECGSSMCIKFFENGQELEGEEIQRCGCGKFETRFSYVMDGVQKHHMVQTCSCEAADSPEACLPIWKRSIMCKYTCSSCLPCQRKRQDRCNADAYCAWQEATDALPAKCKMIRDECTFHQDSNTGHANQADCKADKRCKWQTVQQHYDTTAADGGRWVEMEKGSWLEKCVSRTFVEVDLGGVNGASPNRKCPFGTTRLKDKYQKFTNTYFDVCVRKEIPDCVMYAWDGESCTLCDQGYRQGQIALNRGNGRIKQNAICVQSASIHNENCAIFAFDAKEHNHEGTGTTWHHCVRCKEEYEWHQDKDGKPGLCVEKHVQNGTTIGAFLASISGTRALYALGLVLIAALAIVQIRSSRKTVAVHQDFVRSVGLR